MNRALALALLSSSLLYASYAAAQEETQSLSWSRVVQERMVIGHRTQTDCSRIALQVGSASIQETTSANWSEENESGEQTTFGYNIIDACTAGITVRETIYGTADVFGELSASLSQGTLEVHIAAARSVRCVQIGSERSTCEERQVAVDMTLEFTGVGAPQHYSAVDRYPQQEGGEYLYQLSSRERAAHVVFSGTAGSLVVEGSSDEGRLSILQYAEIRFPQ